MLKQSLHLARVELRCSNSRIEHPILSATRRKNYHDSNRGKRDGKHLENMNDAQLEGVQRLNFSLISSKSLLAIQFPPSTSLQILAGPGTGKTRVLTSRIAELIKTHSLPPSSVCAVTFTKKAATEMQHRLDRDLGPNVATQIAVGTFHRICNR